MTTLNFCIRIERFTMFRIARLFLLIGIFVILNSDIAATSHTGKCMSFTTTGVVTEDSTGYHVIITDIVVKGAASEVEVILENFDHRIYASVPANAANLDVKSPYPFIPFNGDANIIRCKRGDEYVAQAFPELTYQRPLRVSLNADGTKYVVTVRTTVNSQCDVQLLDINGAAITSIKTINVPANGNATVRFPRNGGAYYVESNCLAFGSNIRRKVLPSIIVR